MNDDILKVFEGLDPDQVRELRRRIVPALEQLRAEIVSRREGDTIKTSDFRSHRSSLPNGTMQRTDKIRAAV